jgi:flavorubredoxin
VTYATYSASSEIDVLVYHDETRRGLIPVNAYLVRSSQPLLVDTGLLVLGSDFRTSLRRLIDLEDLRWIWITHEDTDHSGSIEELLRLAPRATLVGNGLAIGRLGEMFELPIERLHLLRPGERLDIGDRFLAGVRPPIYDSPGTLAAFDERTRTLFSSDCFGAVIPEAAEHAEDIEPGALAVGQELGSWMISQWLGLVHRQRFARALRAVRQLDPAAIMSAHLPPARGITERMLSNLSRVPDSEPYVGLSQAELDEIVEGLSGSDHTAISTLTEEPSGDQPA